jgi:hypothetical protein
MFPSWLACRRIDSLQLVIGNLSTGILRCQAHEKNRKNRMAMHVFLAGTKIKKSGREEWGRTL